MTGNTFTGLSNCDSSGIRIYGIPEVNMTFSGNTVDDSTKVAVYDGTGNLIDSSNFTAA